MTTDIAQGPVDVTVRLRDLPPEGSALRKLGARLAELLDEDQWAECERMLFEVADDLRKGTVFVPIETSSHAEKNGRHPNDDTPRDAECQSVLDRMGDDQGQGLSTYWKWGFRSGWYAHKKATPNVVNHRTQGSEAGRRSGGL